MNATARLWIGGLVASFCTLATAAGVPVLQTATLRAVPSAKGIHAGSDAKISATLLAAARAVSAPPGANAISVQPDYVQSFIAHEVAPDATIPVVVRGDVNDGLVAAIEASGARDVKDFRAFGQVTANVPAGAVVTAEGGAGDGFFVIDSGEAAVTVGGQPRARLEAGDHFGEIALLTGADRTATVTASSDVRCYALTPWDFRTLVEEQPSIAWKVMQSMAARLSE